MGDVVFREVWTEPVGVIISKLFMIYLLVTVIITSVRIVQLTAQLGLFQLKRKYVGDKIFNDVDTIAEAALKRNFKRVIESHASINNTNKRTLQFNLDNIETEFLYLWETCYAKVQATKSLATMTMLLTACIAFVGSYKICSVLMYEEIDRFTELAYWRDLFFLIIPGIIVSAYSYASAFWFQGTFARRKINWNHAKARFGEVISTITIK